jgi:hypothetical protein
MKPKGQLRATGHMKSIEAVRARMNLKPMSGMRAKKRMKPNESMRKKSKENTEMEKNKFDKFSINELETKVEESAKDARDAQKMQIEVLFYLKVSGRYKESNRYEKSSFYSYIEDRFNIRRGTYMEMQMAFIKFPKETREFGVGVVSRVMRDCGAIKAKSVLEKLNTAQETSKTILKRAKIEGIIQSNAKPKQIKKEITDWRVMYETESRAHEETKVKLKEAYSTIRKLQEQINKLKVTAQRITDIRTIIEKPVQQIHA